jgi:uncharacterized protein YecE (DUF72 family)
LIYVGTSGWSYASWRGTYYPKGLPPGRWFDHVMAQFGTVEVNASFYRLPKPGVFSAWGLRTPPGGLVAVKASRYLTHIRRLREPAEPVARLMGRAGELGPRLGPVLLQLPPDFAADLELLEATLRQFPEGVRLAVETRHASWWTDEYARVLARYDAAHVWSDRHSRPLGPTWRTAGWGYLRMHEGAAEPWPHYGDAALATWVRRLTEAFGAEDDVFVYFNNDPGAAAPDDASRFAARVVGSGRPCSVRTAAA